MDVIEKLNRDLDRAEEAINVTFVLICAIIIFMMQPGFAFLEAGSVRAKNTTNILVKNVIVTAIGAIVYWSTGYAFAFGSDNNGMIGTNKFFLINTPASELYQYFFQYTFAVTSATIVSGAVAERSYLWTYLVYTVVMTGFIYPVVSHWCWSDNGWLSNLSFEDFAGSTVVHICGGTAALVACTILGPRIGRFENGRVLPLPGHSIVLVTLGFFLLWFGFFAFNGGSEGGIAGADFNPNNVSRAVVSTSLSGAAAMISSLLVLKIAWKRNENFAIFGKKFTAPNIFGGYWSLCGGINGGLTGMVAICAGCNTVEPWAAVCIGAIAGVAYCFWSHLFLNLHIDDPVHAGAVHLGGGIWGTLAVAIFAHGDRLAKHPNGGVLYGGDADAFIWFGIQCIGAAVVFAWVAACTILLFGSLRLLGLFRVSPAAEEDGLDYVNGEPAYPIDPALLQDTGYDTSDYSDAMDDVPRT